MFFALPGLQKRFEFRLFSDRNFIVRRWHGNAGICMSTPFSNAPAAMNRQDRLLAIVMELQGRRWQRAEDLSIALAVSTRTIYRDMRALEESQIPIVAVPGKGYSLNADYLLPPMTLTSDEAVAILLGVHYIARHSDPPQQTAARSARMKIESVLPEEIKRHVKELQGSTRFMPVNVFDDPAEQASLQKLRRAWLEQRTVSFGYRNHPSGESKDNDTTYVVDPYGLVRQSAGWHLIGFNRQRQSVHTYSISRMDGLRLLDQHFLRPPGYRSLPDEEEEIVVQALFAGEVATWVENALPFPLNDVEKTSHGLLTTFLVRREEEAVPWLLGWGSFVCVLAPSSLRRRLAYEAGKMQELYQSEPVLLF